MTIHGLPNPATHEIPVGRVAFNYQNFEAEIFNIAQDNEKAFFDGMIAGSDLSHAAGSEVTFSDVLEMLLASESFATKINNPGFILGALYAHNRLAEATNGDQDV